MKLNLLSHVKNFCTLGLASLLKSGGLVGQKIIVEVDLNYQI